MRLAIAIAPTYEGDERLKPVSASAGAERVATRLAQPDARFRVERLAGDHALTERLAQLLNVSQKPEALLVFLGGHVRMADEGELMLRLDGQAELSPAVLRRLLVDAAEDVLVMMDLTHDPDFEDLAPSASVVDAVREQLSVQKTRLSLLIAARPSDPPEASPLTALCLSMLDRLATRPRPITADAVYAAMRGDADEFYRIPAAAYFQGEGKFPLLVEGPPETATGSKASEARARGDGVRAKTRSERPAASAKKPPAAELGTEELVRTGDADAAAGRYDQALAAYKRALLILGAQRTPAHRDIHVKVGNTQRWRGADAQALSSFEKALAIDPLHEPAYEAAAELLRGQKDWPRLDQLLRRRLQAEDAPEKKRALLRATVELWLDGAHDVRQGGEALERALKDQPEDVELLSRLAEVETTLGRHAAAINTRKKLALALGNGHSERRARVLAEAARAAAEHLPNKADAVALAEQALSSDPASLDALELAATLLGRQRNWKDLVRIYDSVIERTESDELCWDLSRKVGAIYRDELADKPSAKAFFARALRHNPGDVELRYRLAELYEADRELDQAADQFRASAKFVQEPDVYRRALGLFDKTRQPDAAWNAAAVLELLGEADINEQLLADAHRPDGLLAVQGGLGEQDWAEPLLSPERDDELDAVLRAIAAPAIRGEIARLREAGLLTELDPEARLDPATNTTMLARSFVWTARVIGIEPPRLYVANEVEGELTLLQAADPTAIASRTLGSGLDLSELSFLWGRHLAYYRPEHYLLGFFGTLQALAGVLLAALSLGGSDGEAPSSLDGETLSLLERLRGDLSEEEQGTLRDRVRGFQPKNTRRRLLAWARSVHLACGRAGLLACGDIQLAAGLVRRFPPRGELSPDEQIHDFYSYSISREYSQLREKLGVAVRG